MVAIIILNVSTQVGRIQDLMKDNENMITITVVTVLGILLAVFFLKRNNSSDNTLSAPVVEQNQNEASSSTQTPVTQEQIKQHKTYSKPPEIILKEKTDYKAVIRTS